jgi:hypothetical protein
MSKRIFSLVVIVLIASVLWSAIVHACSDQSSMRAILQAPCDQMGSQDEPRGKTEKDNCDSIRYGMLSTQVSSSQSELFKFHSTQVHQALLVSVTLLDVLPLFGRSQGPPARS